MKHLSRYVGESTCRPNKGNVRIDTIDRFASLVAASAGKRLIYLQAPDRENHRRNRLIS